MKELLMRYKRETGNQAFHNGATDLEDVKDTIDLDEFDDVLNPSEIGAFEKILKLPYFNQFYFIDRDFLDWLIKEASK